MFRVCHTFAIAFVLTTIATAQSDQVFVKGGSSISGRVVASTQAEISIDMRGTPRKIKVNQLRRVSFAGEPTELNAGRGKALAGKYRSALSDLSRIDPASIKSELIKRDLQFFLAFCEGKIALSTGGDKQAASDKMLAFVRSVPQSFHFYKAAQLLGDLAVAQGDYDKAVSYYGAIAKSPFPEYQLGATLSQARALVGKADFAKAQQAFQSVLDSKSDDTESKRLKRFAEVGLGRCMAETSSPAQGVSVIEKIIANNDSTDGELFARAYNALGDCLRKADKPKEALMAYLHVDVLFYSDADTHAEALYHLSQLWDAAKKPDRAVAAKNLLQERYAGSVWANR